MEVDNFGRSRTIHWASGSITELDYPRETRRLVPPPISVVGPPRSARTSLAFSRRPRVLAPNGTPAISFTREHMTPTIEPTAGGAAAASPPLCMGVSAPSDDEVRPPVPLHALQLFDGLIARVNGFLDSDFSDDEGPTEPPNSVVRASSVWTRWT